MRKPQLFGADYSVYVRIARLALHEKGIPYDLVPIDIFASEGVPRTYLERQPFGKIPAFEHEDFRLYETSAITRYVDEAFDGPALQPDAPMSRARVNQLISIADGYLYPQLVWGMYVELVSKAARGEAADTNRVAAAQARAPLYLEVLSRFLAENRWFGSDDGPMLADLYVAPMIEYFLMVPEGRKMFSRHQNLVSWWDHIGERESMELTRPKN